MSSADNGLGDLIRREKHGYRQAWYAHDTNDEVNPVRFFDELRRQTPDDAGAVLDDGNHTFLAAELFEIRAPESVVLPSDCNCMGYAVPTAIGAKLAHPNRVVNAIVGDGAFAMTCIEIITASRERLGSCITPFMAAGSRRSRSCDRGRRRRNRRPPMLPCATMRASQRRPVIVD